MPFSVTADNVIAVGALAVATWAAVKADRFNRRQIQWERTAERLNQLLIEKEAAEHEAQRRAELGVNFVKIGRGDLRLKVFNRGKAAARNVSIEELSEDGLLIQSDINRKFPAPVIEPQMSVEVIAAASMDSPARTHIRLTWDDDFGLGQTKEFHPTR